MRAGVLVWALSVALGCESGGESPYGHPCRTSADCGELECVAALDAAPEDLAELVLQCGDRSAAAPPGSSCEEPADCDRGLCVLAGACAEPCGSQADCPAHERCQQLFARTGAEALQSVSACVSRVALPADVEVDRPQPVERLTAGRSSFDLQPSEAPVTLYAVEHAFEGWPHAGRCRAGTCIAALETRDEPPRVLFDADADYRNDAPPLNPVASGDHLDPVTVLLPSGEAAALSSRGYRITVESEREGELGLTRLRRSSAGQRLDLNVFYAGARDLAPEGSRGPPLLAEALEEVDRIFAQADVFIGEVRQIAIPGGLLARGLAFPAGDAAAGFAVLRIRFGVYAELPYLFKLSAGANNSAIDLFFVGDIAPRGGDGEPQAEAGGIPGPLGMHGTGSSGIAIATDMMRGDGLQLGRTLAHEIGHYLGLFHTSEADGSVLDALADTPECRSDRDRARNGLDRDDCNDAGADNLMFWSVTQESVLTAQQGAVLRSAVVLH